MYIGNISIIQQVEEGLQVIEQIKKVSYSINKMKQYDLYLSVIKELASIDNISISPFFVEIDPVLFQNENKINLPYIYAHEWRTTSHEIKAYLKCAIRY